MSKILGHPSSWEYLVPRIVSYQKLPEETWRRRVMNREKQIMKGTPFFFSDDQFFDPGNVFNADPPRKKWVIYGDVFVT